jgi:hypothetical protein
MKNIEDLQVHKLTKVVHDQLGDDFAPKDSIKQGIEDAIERNALRTEMFIQKANDQIEKGKEPYPCFNSVCFSNNQEENSCKKNIICYDCLFQMTSPPPNSINYSMNEKIPSHQEALDLLVENGLLKDESWEHQIEHIYFRNQKKPKTQYERGQVEIKGVTMDHLRVVILNFLEEFFNDYKTIIGNYEFPPIAKDFDFTDEGDREIFARNICTGIEKVMGIYPNIRSLM